MVFHCFYQFFIVSGDPDDPGGPDGPYGPGSPDFTGGGSLVRGPTCQGVLQSIFLSNSSFQSGLDMVWFRITLCLSFETVWVC